MELDEGAAFCQNCGAKIEAEPAPAEPTPEEFAATAEPVAEEFGYDAPPTPVKKKKSKAPIIILIVVLVVLLLVVPLAILLLVIILGGGAAALLAVVGMAKKEPDMPNLQETPGSSYFEEFEEDVPSFEFEDDQDEIIGGIIGGIVEDEKDVATTFSDPDNTYYTDGEITINPTYVYWKPDGSLVVEANVVNGKSFSVGDLDLDELSVYNGNGELVACGYFGRLDNLTLDSHYYEEWEFTFHPQYTNPGTDLSGLYCVAEFYYGF
jgi:hypothetical protein